jgi:hypothetical protein
LNRADQRRDAILDVVKLRKPLLTAVEVLRTFPWDWADLPLAELTVSDVCHAIDAYLAGELDAQDLSFWANSVEARDDLAVSPSSADVIREILFELITPEINFEITQEQAGRWKQRLTEKS